MKITDALLGEHGAIYALLDHVERSCPRWSLEEARSFLRAIERHEIPLVLFEQPVDALEDLIAIARESRVPVCAEGRRDVAQHAVARTPFAVIVVRGTPGRAEIGPAGFVTPCGVLRDDAGVHGDLFPDHRLIGSRVFFQHLQVPRDAEAIAHLGIRAVVPEGDR